MPAQRSKNAAMVDRLFYGGLVILVAFGVMGFLLPAEMVLGIALCVDVVTIGFIVAIGRHGSRQAKEPSSE